MASGLFDIAAEALEQHSSLDRLEARGTLRIALKAAGIDAKSLTTAQLGVIFDKLLPHELATRGIEDAAQVCAAVMVSVKNAAPAIKTADGSENAFDVFSRLGGD
jgi:hypothetical protein